MRSVEGGTAHLQAADRSGRHQVGTWNEQGTDNWRVIVWRDGTPRLGPEADPYGGFNAVSPTGVAVGWVSESGLSRAVAYAYGRVVELAAPVGASQTVAEAVNASGQVAGKAYFDGDGTARAVRWSPDGEVRVLDNPTGYADAVATHIDTDGTVLGYATVGIHGMPDRSQLVVWDGDGTARLLPIRPTDSYPWMWPIDLRDGVVHGTQESDTLRWDLDQSAPTVVDTGGTAVRAVNARGSILADDRDGVPVLILDGTVRPLDDGYSISPVDLSDNDVVFGRSRPGAWPFFFDCR